MKRRPRYRSKIYKNPKWGPYWQGSDKYELKGEEIQRDPKVKWRILLKESYRDEQGNVQKRQWHIATITYWDIVHDFLDSVRQGWEDMIYNESIRCGLEKHFPEDRLEELWRLIDERYLQIKEATIDEYKKSEEYHWFLQNQKMENSKSNPNRKREERERKQREQEERRKQDEERQRQEYYRHRSQDHERFFKSSSGLKLSDQEKPVFDRLLKAGYRKLATELHPDHGGDTEEMKILNVLKDKLQELTM